jgi:hypothetical protein
MKKVMIVIAAVLLLLPALSKDSFAVDFNLGDLSIGMGSSPPPYEMRGEPELLPIPGRYAYYVPDIDVDIFFYHGRWYRPHKDRWFRSDSYNGPWDRIRDIPAPLQDLPRDYRSSTPRGYYQVPYGELRDNWEKWEREKYWDRSRDEERERLGRRMGPPPYEMRGEPKLLPIPGRYVYFVADIDMDIFFYHGRWYRPHKDRWFRSDSYNGPWDRIRDIPAPLQDLPRVFYRVPYGELRDNWEKWEKEKYWDRQDKQDRGGHEERR